MSKILGLRDLLEIAEELHQDSDGKIGVWPFFSLVRWTDERMGMATVIREMEIHKLVEHARQERDLCGRRTTEAISFDAVPERLTALLLEISTKVAEARGG